MPKVRYLQIGEYKVELVGYNAKLRKEGFHLYQAVMWRDVGGAGRAWQINGRGYIVGKEPNGSWLAIHPDTEHQIYLGRTLKEAWAMLRLIYSS